MQLEVIYTKLYCSTLAQRQHEKLSNKWPLVFNKQWYIRDSTRLLYQTIIYHILGKFLQLKASKPTPITTVNGALQSPVIQQSIGSFCFEFYYYLFGPEVGSLSLYIEKTNIERTKIWSRHGSQTDSWHFFKQTIPKQNATFTVRELSMCINKNLFVL